MPGRRQFLHNAASVGAMGFLPWPNLSFAKSKATSFQWKMVTTWPKNFPGLGTGANKLAEKIEMLSNGRLKIRVYGAGELVPALGVFDAVKGGTAEIGHGAAYYWKGKNPATQFFAAVPFGLNAQEMTAWLLYGEGQELWDQLYADFGLKAFCCGNTGVQMGGWFNKPIDSLKDLKGLRMRMPGLGGEVLTQLGSAVVTLSGGEIFQALQAGTIDATEWVGPYNDLAFGLHKAAKLYYWPGWHEPGTALEALINQSAWEKLPSDLKEIVKVACQSATTDMIAEFTARNSTALKTLVQKHNVKLKKFPDSVLEKLGQTAQEVVQNSVKDDSLGKKIFESFSQFRRRSDEWSKISEQGYSLARSLTFSGK